MMTQSCGERSPNTTCALPPGSVCILSDVVYDAFRQENCAVPYHVELCNICPASQTPVPPLTVEAVETMCSQLGEWQITQREGQCAAEQFLTAQVDATLRVTFRDSTGARFTGIGDIAIPINGKVHVSSSAVMPFTLMTSASITATRSTYFDGQYGFAAACDCFSVSLLVTSMVVVYITSKVPVIVPSQGIYQVPLLPPEAVEVCDFGLPLFPDYQLQCRPRNHASCSCNCR